MSQLDDELHVTYFFVQWEQYFYLKVNYEDTRMCPNCLTAFQTENILKKYRALYALRSTSLPGMGSFLFFQLSPMQPIDFSELNI